MDASWEELDDRGSFDAQAKAPLKVPVGKAPVLLRQPETQQSLPFHQGYIPQSKERSDDHAAFDEREAQYAEARARIFEPAQPVPRPAVPESAWSTPAVPSAGRNSREVGSGEPSVHGAHKEPPARTASPPAPVAAPPLRGRGRGRRGRGRRNAESQNRERDQHDPDFDRGAVRVISTKPTAVPFDGYSPFARARPRETGRATAPNAFPQYGSGSHGRDGSVRGRAGSGDGAPAAHRSAEVSHAGYLPGTHYTLYAYMSTHNDARRHPGQSDAPAPSNAATTQPRS